MEFLHESLVYKKGEAVLQRDIEGSETLKKGTKVTYTLYKREVPDEWAISVSDGVNDAYLVFDDFDELNDLLDVELKKY